MQGHKKAKISIRGKIKGLETLDFKPFSMG